MTPQPSPTFRVTCTACYGTEIWHLDRFVRLLTDIGVPSSATQTDVEQLLKLFAAHKEQITCPACGKTDVMIIQQLHRE